MVNALSNISELVWCVSYISDKIVFVNKCAEEFFGLDVNQKHIVEFLDLENKLKYDDILNQLKNGKLLNEIKLEFVCAGGKKKQFVGNVCPLVGDKGKNEMIMFVGDEASFFSRSADKNKNLIAGEHFSVIENMRDAFFILDKNACFLYANKSLETITKKDNTFVLGKIVWEIFSDAKGLLFEKEYKRSVTDKTIVEFEELLPSLSKWLNVRIYPSMQGVSVFIQDVTERKLSSDQLVESERKFHLISDNSPMFIWTLNEKLERTFFNKTFITFSGLSFDELIKSNWVGLVHPEDLERVTIVLHRGFTYIDQMDFEFRMRRCDGEYRWIKMNCTPQLEENGTLKGFLGNGVDVTDLKFYNEKIEEKNRELEHALSESRRLSEMLNKTTNLLVITDATGHIIWVNEAFQRVTEYSFEEVIGKKPGLLVYGPETSIETMDILHEAILKKEITRVEILNYSKYGRKFWVDLRIEPIYKNGISEGYLAIEIDITKQKNNEIAIKERNEKIKEFSFITSHKLRHEFAKVMMLLNLSKTKENTIEDNKALFSHLETPLNNINSIIANINTNLKIGSDQQKSISDRISEMDEIKEICLIDDDKLTNMVHKQIISIMLPGIPIRAFEDVGSALNYFRIQNFSNRLIFLDLNFPASRSGWDFLKDYHDAQLTAPIIILSSSIDNDDIRRSKQFGSVIDYLIKPLTVDVIKKYIKR